MIEDKVTFCQQKWSSWKLENHPDALQSLDDFELNVDQNYIGDVLTYGELTGKAKEPFFGSILNIFMRLVSSFIPGDNFKCAYLLDFKDVGRVQLYISNDIWNSHAQIHSYGDEQDLILLANATKEYIRFRCFVDSIQPLEES